MIFTSFAEVLSIGAVLPFLGVLASPEKVFGAEWLQPAIHAFGIEKPVQLILPLTVAFAAAACLAGAMRLLLLWKNTKIAFSLGSELSAEMYRRTLYQPYEIHCSRNSSEVINGISAKSNAVIYGVLSPALLLVSAGVLFIFIVVAVFSVMPILSISVFAVFGLIYGAIIKSVKKKLSADGECVAYQSSQVIKCLQEGLGGIRDVLIDGSQGTYCKIFRNADLPLRMAQGSSSFISASPRFIVEALGMVFIAVLAYLLTTKATGLETAIPLLGLIALVAQRLLPVLQQSYASWALIQSNYSSLSDVLDLLSQPLPEYEKKSHLVPVVFNQNIRLESVSFAYTSNRRQVINNINLNIDKGSKIGFIGSSGSGKSTLIDIIMGLLEPTSGTLVIDGRPINQDSVRGWQAQLAHVPQSIFLADTTVAENIAFGIPIDSIDHDRVRYAAEKARIAELIQSWPEQYGTRIGERGLRISGGQRQRIGIARALYKQAKVIILDEATSALDSGTEAEVMSAIEGLDSGITVLIIAHRLTTLKECDLLVEMESGKIKRTGSYIELTGTMS